MPHGDDTSGGNITPLPTARRPHKPSAKANRSHSGIVTEDSAAQRFAVVYADKLRFCHDAGAWFEWSGATWRQNKTGIAFEWARQMVRDLAEHEEEKIRYVASRTSFAAGVERFARHDPSFAVTSDYWDANPWLLGSPSGTIDLQTGRLSAADPTDGITRSTAVAPATVATCPNWMRFLDETCGGDCDLIRFLQMFVGYSLTGRVTEHALIFGYGPGGNGKSVFVNTISAIMADYATAATIDLFSSLSGDRHSTDIAMLRGARLVTASETEEGKPWAEAKIKLITGGDKITARFMRKDNFSFAPTFKLFIVGNHRPVLRNVDDAARRRFCIVPFVHKPARPDRDLEMKLRDEWAGILRWMIEGCLDWQRNGLVRPNRVLLATSEYFKSQDVFGQFLDDECDCEPGNQHKTEFVADLFTRWSAYAKAAGEDVRTKKAFSEEMQRRNFEPYRITAGRVFRGVRLKRPKADDDG